MTLPYGVFIDRLLVVNALWRQYIVFQCHDLITAHLCQRCSGIRRDDGQVVGRDCGLGWGIEPRLNVCGNECTDRASVLDSAIGDALYKIVRQVNDDFHSTSMSE